ncbi:hypothetical protein [Paenarthrobacter sp. Z7-10]|uniref:hypothetical protein n=1 Tax=Paenarthrobacter sp. Z7-10 TaxID=2787635 RepID=UPI0022A91A68|nr:hypothetical protein [Paenarthrobacter sp. Z7-10]
MNLKAFRYWTWVTLGLGIAVMFAAYAEAAVVGVWFDEHGLPDDMSPLPELILGALGLLIAAGSCSVGIMGRRAVGKQKR